jgi:D-alanine-D-alanine ligase
MAKRVLHLVGSPVDPLMAELSRLYARDCLEATSDLHDYESVVAHVDPGGRWRLPLGSGPEAIDEASLEAATPLLAHEALSRIATLGVSVVLPQMFCVPGMTAYRDLWTVMGVPLIGNCGSTMALGADKADARAVVAAAGVDVPAGQVVGPGALPDLPFPFVVKPVDADNSAGVTLVRTEVDVEPALAAALRHSPAALVETYIEAGREVRCGIVEHDGELVFLPLEEYRLDPGHPIRTQVDKIDRPDGPNLRLMAKDPQVAWKVDTADPVTQSVWDLAATCHRSLGCRDHSLFDVRIDPSGRPWFLEASLYCSFARQSVVIGMAEAAGIRLVRLFTESVERAIGRGPG